MISYIAWLSSLIPLTQWLFLRRKTFRLLNLAALLLLVSFSFDLLSLFYIHYLKTTNMSLGALYRVIEFALILLLYYQFFESNSDKRVILASGAIGTLLLIYLLATNDVKTANAYFMPAAAFLVVVICLFALNSLVTARTDRPLQREPFFWICIAHLSYFSVSFAVFLLNKQIWSFASSIEVRNLWVIHNIAMIVYHLIISVAIITWNRQSSRMLSSQA